MKSLQKPLQIGIPISVISLDDFYLPLLDQEKHYLSKEYKLLKKNKIDTAEFDGFEKDKNAGEITFTEATEDQKKELYNEVLTF